MTQILWISDFSWNYNESKQWNGWVTNNSQAQWAKPQTQQQSGTWLKSVEDREFCIFGALIIVNTNKN